MGTIEELNAQFEKTAVHVSGVCIVCNLCLALVKLTGGIAAGSSALISDAVNSSFDVLSGIIVIAGAKLSRKESDHEHPYGHERLESVATIVLSIILFVTGIFLGHTVIEDLVSGAYLDRELPGKLSILAALISIITKEILFWYTKAAADKIDSASLRAAAWDHRSDVIGTTGALLGIVISRFGFPEADLIASLIGCTFIIRTAYQSFREAISQMVDRTCTDEVYQQLRECITSVPGVLGIDMMQVRTFGNRLYVDLEISEDGDISLKEAHQVAENVHDALEKNFSVVKHVMVHVNPKQ